MITEPRQDGPSEITPAGFEELTRGPRLALPNVTLVCVDTAHPRLALRAVRHCLRQVEFGAAVFVTRPDHHLTVMPAGLTVVTDDTIHSIADYSRYMFRDLLPHVQTSHCLVVQWDGFVIDTSAWDARFLDFDFIGAILPKFPAGHRVGNGGFSLRSRRLLQALQDPDIVRTHPEDRHLSDTYRDLLERRHGIRFASEALAQRFAVDVTPNPGPTFGLHGLDTLYRLLPAEQFRRFTAGVPDRLFGGGGARHMMKEAVARGDGRLALYVLRQRRKYRRSFWSCLDLWVPVWWAWLRSALMKA